jgi:hypothetical protein
MSPTGNRLWAYPGLVAAAAFMMSVAAFSFSGSKQKSKASGYFANKGGGSNAALFFNATPSLMVMRSLLETPVFVGFLILRGRGSSLPAFYREHKQPAKQIIKQAANHNSKQPIKWRHWRDRLAKKLVANACVAWVVRIGIFLIENGVRKIL